MDQACAICGETKPECFKILFDSCLKLYICIFCGFVAQYTETDIASIVKNYSKAYTLDFLKNGKTFRYPNRERILRDIVYRIKRISCGIKLLDVGSGDDQFLCYCKDSGFGWSGMEPDEILASYSSQKLKIPIINGLYTKELFPEGTFDVISFIQVLEHIDKPLDIISTAYYHLKKIDVLAIEVPSIQSPHFLAYRFTGKKCFVMPPTGVIRSHFGYYSPSTLLRLTEKTGFQTVDLVTGRWKYKGLKLQQFIGMCIDPILNMCRIGCILYLGCKIVKSNFRFL